MRRLLIVNAVVSMFAVIASAQQYTPKVEIGLGYSYSRASVPNSASRVNMNGVIVNAVANVNRWLGAEAELGSHYHCISGCWIDGIRVDNPDARNDSLTFLAGPKVTHRRAGNSLWAHSLFGYSRMSYLNTLTLPDTRMTNSGWGMALGGGMDWNLSRASVRLLQVDYLRSAGVRNAYNNVRIGGGVVLNIGRKLR